ncbi:FAD-dependent monooxygenase [Microbaculum marinum]|uniref:FAD-dependent monooxygenase n=1 Tax=Microbaculum marinum TaxID=1764581 RepID=A0AAW9RLR0_9HYPH
MAADRHIAIAGGGIAGLISALSVAGPGMRVTVFEQAGRLEEVGAGLQVSPNAWRVLEALGLAETVLRLSVAPAAIRMRRGSDGRTIARMPLGGQAERRWGAPYRVIHRADLQDTLVAALEANPNAGLRLGTRIDGFRLGGVLDDGVQISVDGDLAGRFDGLVGADGLWSSIRAQIADEGDPVYSGKVAWRATIAADQVPHGIDPDETGLWLGRDAHLVHYGVRAGEEVNVVAIFADHWSEPGWSAPGRRGDVIARYADWSPLAQAVVAAPKRWVKWALADRPPLSRWGVGPVTLAGDAAHPMLPFLAQGAAMGIEDGHVLGQALAGADDVEAAFRRYENRRMARTARVQRGARANGDIYHLGGIAGRARDAAMGVMGPDRLLARFDWLYGWGRPAAED